MEVYQRKFHFGYPAPTLFLRLAYFEQNNIPHLARGIYTFMIGYLLSHFFINVVNPIWAGILLNFAFTVSWEVRDYYVADGFDFADVTCEVLAALTMTVFLKMIGL